MAVGLVVSKIILISHHASGRHLNLLETVLILVRLLASNNRTAERLVLLSTHHHRCRSISKSLHLHHLLLAESPHKVVVIRKLAVSESELCKLLLEGLLVAKSAVRAKQPLRRLVDAELQAQVVAEPVREVHIVRIHVHVPDVVHVHIHRVEVIIQFCWGAWYGNVRREFGIILLGKLCVQGWRVDR